MWSLTDRILKVKYFTKYRWLLKLIKCLSQIGTVKLFLKLCNFQKLDYVLRKWGSNYWNAATTTKYASHFVYFSNQTFLSQPWDSVQAQLVTDVSRSHLINLQTRLLNSIVLYWRRKSFVRAHRARPSSTSQFKTPWI